MLFAPSVCKGGLRSHFNLISDGREPAREVAGKIAERRGGIMAAEFENYWRSLGDSNPCFRRERVNTRT
jgi:hypothetical protein